MPALLEGAEFLATAAGGDMDPRLQRLTHRRRRGLLQLATASESPSSIVKRVRRQSQDEPSRLS